MNVINRDSCLFSNSIEKLCDVLYILYIIYEPIWRENFKWLVYNLFEPDH